jgi:hypothetical protein
MQRRPQRTLKELALAQTIVAAQQPQDTAETVQHHLIEAFLRLTNGQDGARLMTYLGVSQTGPLSYHVLSMFNINSRPEASSALVSMSTFGRRSRPELPQILKDSLLNLISNLGNHSWNPTKERFDTSEERYALCEQAETFINTVAEQVPSSFMDMIQQAVETIKNGYAQRMLCDVGLQNKFLELTI